MLRSSTLAVATAILASSIACGRAETFGLDPSTTLADGSLLEDGATITDDGGGDPGLIDGGALPDAACTTPGCLDGGFVFDAGPLSDGGFFDGGSFDGSAGPDASLDGGTPAGDGGAPIIDGGSRDAGVVVDGGTPSSDGGPRDSGTFDAGMRDGGGIFVDAGPLDAGPAPDASAPDASTRPDASAPDAAIDAGSARDAAIDAGSASDASPIDTGLPIDGGVIFVDGGPMRDGGVIFVDAGAIDAGSPDTGVPPECNADSDCNFGEHCEPTSQTCVDCLANNDCGFGRVCDTSGGYVCRPQCFNGMCGPFGVCDPTINACVECLADSDCNASEICDTTTRTCVECTSDASCNLEVGQNVCSPSGSCVACASDADCVVPEQCFNAGQSDSFCALPSGRGLCAPCTRDDQCGGPDDHCIGITASGGLIDRACGLDCSTNPMICPSGFACVSVRAGSAQQCRPSYPMQTPTCTAVRNVGAACQLSPTNLDPGCGISGVQDARCVPDANGAGMCSVWCNTNADCPLGVCVGAAPNTVGTCQ